MNAPDLTQLPPPEVVETLDFETILQVHRADLLARYPEAAAVIDLESEPLNKLLQSHAYRELLYRQRVNEAARAHLLAFATGADLDHKAAFYGLTRLAGESDERLRARVQLRIKSLAGNGTREAYELTAMTASQNVRDARATQPFPGRVHLLLWCHDAAQSEATLATVLAAINADDGRPLGVPVTVALARARAINITAAIEREAGAPADLAQRLVVTLADALAAYARLGRDVPRSWITARLHTAQVAAVRFPDPAAPAESTPLDDDEYPTLGVVHIEDVTK
ncbi:baseplate J/gp47 family protein [Acidovorax sp. NPDC077693]|uniref:baseplate assembly protein n=1 Tax=unclassified Acidovorax TaxID=2684926 RepID=UPI0037C67FCA